MLPQGGEKASRANPPRAVIRAYETRPKETVGLDVICQFNNKLLFEMSVPERLLLEPRSILRPIMIDVCGVTW